jgi:predicted DCC family thiol-disulfide oxidoreductase YuxK
MKTDSHPIIFFDGVCNFCNYWVNFAIRRDRRKKLRFAPLQGETARSMLAEGGKKTAPYESVILIDEGKVYRNSSATLRIARHLDGGWKFFYAFIIIPSFIRDGVYKWIARNRYKWYGKKEACMVPSAEVKERFLP